ncbi:hypothetical protein GCM10027596_26660 [Nocardioides korecus]
MIGLDSVKLEVSTDPPAGILTNQVANPSGEYGGSGWITPPAGVSINAVPGRLLELRTNGGVNTYGYTELIPIVPGQWASASYEAPVVRGVYAARLQFQKADGSDCATQPAAAARVGASATRLARPAAQAPSDAAFVRFQWNLYKNTAGTMPPKGYYMRFTRIMVAVGATAAAVTSNPPFNDVTFWRDVTPTTSKITTHRGDLDAGELVATIFDNTLDPATSTALRSGRRVRLSAVDAGGDWDTVWIGTAQRPSADYDPVLKASNDPRGTRITLSAVDDTAKWAARTRARGYYDVANLPALFEGAGVPWVVDGNNGQVAAPAASRSYNAPADTSVLDHTRRVRNSYYSTDPTFYVAAWIDRYAVAQVWFNDTDRTGRRALLEDPNLDTGIDDWEPNPVDLTPMPPSGQTYSAAGLAYVTDTLTVNDHALQITTTAAGINCARTAPVAVRPGQRLNAAFSIRLVSAPVGRQILTNAVFRDSDGAKVAAPTLANTAGYSATTYLGYGDRQVDVPARAVTVELEHMIFNAAGAGETINVASTELYVYRDVRLGQADLNSAPLSNGDGDNFNQLTIDTIYSATDGTGSTSETHGPYVSASSVAQYGPAAATVPTVGWASTKSNLSTFTNYLLSRNSTPETHVGELVIPIRTTLDVARHAFRDVWDLVDVTWPIADFVRVVEVDHTITATSKGARWSCSLVVASPTRLVL